MGGAFLIAARLLLGNPGRLIVLVAGAVSVALATSSILVAASSSNLVVEQTVSAGWRGTYDLLVRPADTPSLVVDGQQLVPLDYLGLPTSGITREQWQRIAHLPDVEVAAPVAALGWLKNSSSTIGLRIVDPQPDQVYAISVRVSIGGADSVSQTGLYAVSAQGPALMAGLHGVIGPMTDATGRPSVLLDMADVPATWGLVVGIDPTAEDQLIGLSGFVGGEYLTSGASPGIDPLTGESALVVPVMTALRSPLPGEVTVSVSIAKGPTPEAIQQELAAQQPRSNEALQHLIDGIVASAELVPVNAAHSTLTELLRPLRDERIGLTPDGRLTVGTEFGGGASLAANNVILVPSLAEYALSPRDGAHLQLLPRGSWTDLIAPQLDQFLPPNWVGADATFGADSTVYRDLHAEEPPPFVLLPVGNFDADAIAMRYAEAANYAPLGLYAPVARALLEDETGNAIAEPLPPSINPAGLNPLTPVGLTNLEAVEALRGDHFIDAIRVRLSGLGAYSPDTLRRLERVAQQIVDATALHVDVVAGSSPVDVRVRVPGVGVISERWTTLGTAARIVSGAQGVSGTLLGSVFVVVLAYLAAFGIYLRAEQAPEIETLGKTGWRPGTLRSLLLIQSFMIGTLSAALAVGLAGLLAWSTGVTVPLAALLAMGAIVLGLHLLAAARAPRAFGARRNADVHAPHGFAQRGMFGTAWGFMVESPVRTAIVVSSLSLALAIAGVICLAEIASQGELRGSVFGQVVLLRLAPYHLLAAGAAFFAAGALSLDAALIAVERRLPTIGMLRATGWRRREVARLIALELLGPAMLAGAISSAAVTAVGLALGSALTLLVIIDAGLFGIAVGLGLLAAVIPVQVALTEAPWAAIRAEGASGTIGRLAPRQALVTITTLMVTVAVVSAGWGAAQVAAETPPPFVQPALPALGPAAARIRADVESLTNYPDRTPASANFEAALAHVGDQLTAAGYRVDRVAYLAPVPEFLDRTGTSLDLDDLSVIALAYDADAWDGQRLVASVTFVNALQGIPQSCPEGIGVIRVNGSKDSKTVSNLELTCKGVSAAVLGVRVSDVSWARLADEAVTLALPISHFLVSEHQGTPAAAQWLVATIDSVGPGATDSAAPVAVAVEVARRAAESHVPVRIAIASLGDRAAISVLLRYLPTDANGEMIWLGPMGGPASLSIGTQEADGLDLDSARAGLLGIGAIDRGFASWLDRLDALADSPTSPSLLGQLADATHLSLADEGLGNLYALALGWDAAWVAEPVIPPDPRSVAGTSLDTVAVLDPRHLDALAGAILDTLGSYTQ